MKGLKRSLGLVPILTLWLGLWGFMAPALEAKTIDETPLKSAQTEIPEDLLLDVGIELFDPGLPPDNEHGLEDKGVFADVRKAEARFIPVSLMDTLQSTGYWGAVRVVPRGAGQVDLLIRGKILQSSGLELEVEIEAKDSRGVFWLKRKTYKAKAESRAYREDVAGEPFQHLYNHIANQLLKMRSKRDEQDLMDIRQVSSLAFAADLAPMIFKEYLTHDRKGRKVVKRLPAAGDPMAERVELIRERDYLFVDTLTEHYAGFQAHMLEPYDSWRRYSYEEELTLKDLKRQARTRKILGGLAIAGAILAGGEGGNSGAAARDLAIYAGIHAIQSGMGKTQEAKLHRESLRELALSFDAEVAPILVEVEGQTLRLSGSTESQFVEWRRLLRLMFAEETGVLLDPNDAQSAAAPAILDAPTSINTVENELDDPGFP